MSRWYSLAVLLLLFAVFPNAASAQAANRAAADPVWSLIDALPNDRPLRVNGIRAQKFKSVEIRPAALRNLLAAAPSERVYSPKTSPAVISLPMPDGGLARFRFVESPVMAPELAAKFPEIKTYLGEGLDDPQATVRFDLTPAGLHAQILSPNGTVYIDPAFRGEDQFHTSYFKRDYVRSPDGFQCLLEEDAAAGRGTAALTSGSSGGNVALARSGASLRTYRLAVAATGEYTAYHGGTVTAGMAAIVTAVNRVTGVYETELAIRLVLVANNELLVYTNGNTDPFANGTPSSLLTQNQSTIDSIIGSANYDIGHVFSTAGGGLAGLGVVCVGGQKARGETGNSAPIGDAFYIDYVAHEMGHQFGADHTFNSSTSNCGGGNRNASTAYEPGSGSTIMAYAGICGSDDLQPHSDPYFHSISFDEILNYSTASSGNSCAVITATGNTAPIVSAGANYSIPQNTPFTLTATGSDPDGDPITFGWEERDLGASTTLGAVDNGSSPLFRSWNPTTNPSRTFPRLLNLLNNSLPVGEVMPTTTRTMNFRVTARDNRAGGGGVSTADMQVSVSAAAGPFQVTSHNSGGTFSGFQTVTWNVAGTTAAPINTSSVNILLSTNGGLTFPITLAGATANDGSELVLFPNITASAARIKVEAVDNIYFDVCNANFTIVSAIPAPLVIFDSAALVAESCSPTNNAIDPGEWITVNLALRNVGTLDATNVVATLLLTNGVAAAGGTQSYGLLPAGGPAVVMPFSLLATGSCGGSFATSLQLQSDSGDLGLAQHEFNLGSLVATTTERANATKITIPYSGTRGIASPFPSAIAVAGVTGTVSKVTVTFDGFSHAWPGDVDALLVGPTGQAVLLMSDVSEGAGLAVNNLSLTFDDAAAANLPASTLITSGSYKPTNYGSGDSFSAPAPGGAYGSALAVFNGLNPNGNWSLYIQDDSSQDVGSVAQGWHLSITTSNGSCCTASPPVSDLVLWESVSAPVVNVGSNVMVTLAVSNAGPDTASGVVLSNRLPAEFVFVSAVTSQGTLTNLGSFQVFDLGTLASNEAATVTLEVRADSAGIALDQATVVTGALDPEASNNTVNATLSANGFPTITGLTNLTTDEDIVAGPMEFAVGDTETDASALVVSVTTTNVDLVPPGNLALGGLGSVRSVTITPATNQFGTAHITVSVSDGMATNASSFDVTFLPVNDPPVLAPIPDFVIESGQRLSFTNVAADVETSPAGLRFALPFAPANATLTTNSGVFEWVPEVAQAGTTNLISITVNDDDLPSMSATQTFSVVVLPLTNHPPVVSGVSNFTVVEGETLSFAFSTVDPDEPTNGITVVFVNAPPNATMTFTNGSGTFQWVTTEADGPGTNAVQLLATKSSPVSLTFTQDFTLTVLESNLPPTLVGISDHKIHAGTTLTFTNAATDPDLPLNALAFSVDPGNSPAAQVNPTNGVFSWTPSDADVGEVRSITIRVTDNGSPELTDSKTFLVSVVSRPVLTDVTLTNEMVRLTWTSLAGGRYRVQCATNLLAPAWLDCSPDILATEATVTETNVWDSAGLRLYRVVIVP